MYHNVYEAHYESDKEEEIIIDSEINDIEMNTDELFNKNDHKTDVDNDTEG